MTFFSNSHERLLRKFINQGVEFVLVGGHAAVFYGVRRTTSDIDILIRPTQENGTRILKAFQDLRLDVEDIKAVDFVVEQVFTFGFEPDAVDIINFSKGVTIDEIFDRAQVCKLDGLQIPIIDLHDLIKNKESLNRVGERNLVDQQDILALKRIQRSRS